jgi:MOSC domain-containing protein
VGAQNRRYAPQQAARSALVTGVHTRQGAPRLCGLTPQQRRSSLDFRVIELAPGACHANRPSSPVSGHVQVGSVAALWRYPVKSMMGAELNSSDVTDRGLLGDRQFAMADRATGKVGGAKNPRKWGNFFDFRATYPEPPRMGATAPGPGSPSLTAPRSRPGKPTWSRFCRGCSGGTWPWRKRGPGHGPPALPAEEYWPDMAGRDYRDTATDFEMPAGTFFDIGVVHLLTTATLDRLRALYPQGRFEARRFRPNIVISTSGEDQVFVENDWVGAP